MHGKEKLKVLLLDDDPEDVEQVERMLADDFAVDVIDHLASVTDHLKQGY